MREVQLPMTTQLIESAQIGSKVLHDKYDPRSVQGLQLRVKPSGVKSFFLYYVTRQGQERRPKIGDYPTCSLEEARKRAKVLLNQVAVGEDPKYQWDTEKQELLVDEIFAECYSTYWSMDRFKDSGWARQVFYNYNNHLKVPFGRLRISELTAPKIQNWLDTYRENRTAGNRSLEVLSKLFNYALRKGYVEKMNPCGVVEAYTEKKRKRYASTEEIIRIIAILKREKARYPREVAFIYLLMLTGSRPRMIERARFLDIQRREDGVGVLTMKGKSSEKTGQEETLILPVFAMQILDELGPTANGTLTGIKTPSRFWLRVCEEAWCEDFWLRDWRRTFATIALSNGVGTNVLSELLNHHSTQTTKNYAKLLPDSRIEAAAVVSSKIQDEIMKESHDQEN